MRYALLWLLVAGAALPARAQDEARLAEARQVASAVLQNFDPREPTTIPTLTTSDPSHARRSIRPPSVP